MEEFTLCLARTVRLCLWTVLLLSGISLWLICCHAELLVQAVRAGMMILLSLICLTSLVTIIRIKI